MADRISAIKASVGFYSATGPRRDNEDFAAGLVGADLPEPRREVVAAIADGIGSAKGGRIAAETAVRGFLDGMSELPETAEVHRSAARVLNALNAWMHSQGQRDPRLAGMGCTFTALVLRNRLAHVLHIGDTRAYRLSGTRLSCLTTDHVRAAGPSRPGTLYRALGVEAEVRLEYTAQPMARHDRFLLCSDGLHGWLTDESIAQILSDRSAPADTARALVTAALRSGSNDNCTALVLDVIELPTAESPNIGAAIMQLPIVPVPLGGETIDGFVLKALISDGRYSRLFAAQ
ncbi:MAG TPA: protein phosphatase 2C domain-containing protein, partial [Steroidobacteraceae bacterium]|nr:protein phosphatase 2C domain-containing protein [Steroidobacteraceae bacterium]